MAWTSSAPDLPRSFGAAPVPEAEGLRRTALQASWRRDRRVALRRKAMRWAAWYAVRALPLLAIAAAAGLAVAYWPFDGHSEQAAERPAPSVMPPKPAPPEPHPGEPVLQLRLEIPLQSPPAAPGPPSASVPLSGRTTGTPESPSPQLKPDNWLHSKEP